jgi:hypothetical protein
MESISGLSSPSERRMSGIERRSDGYALVTSLLRNELTPAVLKAANLNADQCRALAEERVIRLCTNWRNGIGHNRP